MLSRHLAPSFLDHLKAHFYTAVINHWRHPVTEAEHDQQKALVVASDRLSPDKTERHNSYAVQRCSKGWTNSPVIRDTVSTRRPVA